MQGANEKGLEAAGDGEKQYKSQKTREKKWYPWKETQGIHKLSPPRIILDKSFLQHTIF